MTFNVTDLCKIIKERVIKARNSNTRWGDPDYFVGPVSGRFVCEDNVVHLARKIGNVFGFSESQYLLVMEENDLLYVVGGSHRLQVVVGVIPVRRIPYKVVNLHNLSENFKVSVYEHSSFVVGSVQCSEPQSQKYSTIQDTVLFMDILEKSEQYYQEQSQLVAERNLNITLKNNAAFILAFYEENFRNMCAIVDRQNTRAKKLTVIHGLMKINEMEGDVLRKLLGLVMGRHVEFESGQIVTVSYWKMENIVKVIKFAAQDCEWSKTEGQKLFVKSTLEEAERNVREIDEPEVSDTNNGRPRKRKASIAAWNKFSGTRTTTGHGHCRRKQGKPKKRKDTPPRPSCSYYDTIDVYDLSEDGDGAGKDVSGTWEEGKVKGMEERNGIVNEIIQREDSAEQGVKTERKESQRYKEEGGEVKKRRVEGISEGKEEKREPELGRVEVGRIMVGTEEVQQKTKGKSEDSSVMGEPKAERREGRTGWKGIEVDHEKKGHGEEEIEVIGSSPVPMGNGVVKVYRTGEDRKELTTGPDAAVVFKSKLSKRRVKYTARNHHSVCVETVPLPGSKVAGNVVMKSPWSEMMREMSHDTKYRYSSVVNVEEVDGAEEKAVVKELEVVCTILVSYY